MQIITELLNNLTDPQWIVQNGGLYIVVLIVFIETGLIFGFFLPGDPLLFIAGMIIANTIAPFSLPLLNLLYWIVLIATAGVIGNYVSYWFGRKSDGLLFQGKDTWIFKQKYLTQARAFYDRKGGGAIVLARFVPVVRTFAPIIAGVVKMNAGKFSFYNILGSFLWAGTIVSAGFLLGENEWVKSHLEWIVIGIVGAATAPVILKMITKKFRPGV
jgi:membrane-associated protein